MTATRGEQLNVDWHEAVRVASNINGNLAAAFAAGQTVDDVVLVAGDRILLMAQTAADENGLYVVQAAGAPIRARDGESAARLRTGACVPVQEGYANGGTVLQLTTLPGFVVGVNALRFDQMAGTPSSREVERQNVALAALGTLDVVLATVPNNGRQAALDVEVVYSDNSASSDVASAKLIQTFYRAGGFVLFLPAQLGTPDVQANGVISLAMTFTLVVVGDDVVLRVTNTSAVNPANGRLTVTWRKTFNANLT